MRGDGTIDDKEVAELEGIAAWMDINKESIFDTRPWKVFGEGPTSETSNPVNGPGFNEGKLKYSAADIRFNQKGNILYATVMGSPTTDIIIKSLVKGGAQTKLKNIEVLGSEEKIQWKQKADSIEIKKPKIIPNKIALVFKIQLQ